MKTLVEQFKSKPLADIGKVIMDGVSVKAWGAVWDNVIQDPTISRPITHELDTIK